MAKRVKIEIRDSDNSVIGALDIHDHATFPLALTFSIADIKDATKRTGSFSKDFNIPATKDNNELLKYLYNTNTQDNQELKAFKPCVIYVNNIPQIKGKIRVKEINYTRSPLEYVLNVFANNADWVEEFRNLKVSDLDYGYDDGTFEDNLSYVDVNTVTPNNDIRTTWTKTYDDGWDFQYPLINYGAWSGSNRVFVRDMRPALYIRGIIDKGFESLGYTIKSTFLDTAGFKKKILPFVGEFLLTQETADNAAFRAGLTTTFSFNVPPGTDKDTFVVVFDDETTGDNFDTGGNYNNATGKYTAPTTGNYEFTSEMPFEMEIIRTGQSTVVAELEIYVNGVKIISQGVTSSAGSANVTVKGNAVNNWFLGLRGILSSGVVEARILIDKTVITDDVTFRLLPVSANGLNTAFIKATLSRDIVERGVYKIKDVIDPELTVLDVINMVNPLFNLYWETNTQLKEVTVEPRDDFYKNTAQAINWSLKMDISKQFQISFLQDYNRDLLFQYKQDSGDGALKVRNEEEGIGLGDFEYTLPDRFPKGESTVKTDFSSTFHIIDTKISTSGTEDSSPFLPRMWKENSADPPQYSNDFDHRILHYEGFISHNNADWRFYRESDGVTTTFSTIPLAYMADILEGSGDSLYYDNETAAPDGLFDTYWNKTIGIIREGVLLECWVKLNEKDIAVLDLGTPIYFDRPFELKGYWIINKIIDYQPAKDTVTKVELLKVISVDKISIPTSKGRPDRPNDIPPTPIWTPGGGIDPDKDDCPADTRGHNPKRPSTVLNNGSGNTAVEGSGAVVVGTGLIAVGQNPVVLGQYNDPDCDNVLEIGGGCSDDERYNAISIDKDGDLSIYGGEVWAELNGEYKLVVAEIDNDIKQVYKASR